MPETRPKPFVFVLMPFSEAFQDIYNLGIRDTCTSLNLHCERVDEQVYQGTILDRIYNQIAKADIIVSDMTGRNANVFYETGYAHALGKTVILLTQKAEDIPFDLVHYSHIVYGSSITKLKEELAKRLKWWVENPTQSLASVDFPLEVFLRDRDLKYEPQVPVSFASASKSYIQAALTLHNTSSRILDSDALRVCMLSDAKFETAEGFIQSYQLPDGRRYHTFPEIPTLFPDSWHVFPFRININPPGSIGHSIPLQIAILTALGTRNFSFSLHIVPPETVAAMDAQAKLQRHP